MVDRLMQVVEVWLEAQVARLGALDDGRRAHAVPRKHAASLRCARCRAPFRTDEGRRRHLRTEPQCTVRADAPEAVEGTGVGGRDVPLCVKGGGAQCEYPANPDDVAEGRMKGLTR